jgi:protein CsiD
MTVWQENIMQGLLLRHEDSSDSYLRKAYRNMDLHTDGTYVKE